MKERVIGIGDIVRLNSGGPDMTVVYMSTSLRDGSTMLVCSWLDEDGELRTTPSIDTRSVLVVKTKDERDERDEQNGMSV